MNYVDTLVHVRCCENPQTCRDVFWNEIASHYAFASLWYSKEAKLDVKTLEKFEIAKAQGKKYIMLDDDTISIGKKTLKRICACRKVGKFAREMDLGGYIESEDNLSHEGDCWISAGSKVYNYSCVRDDGFVFASVLSHSYICDNAVAIYSKLEDSDLYESSIVYESSLSNCLTLDGCTCLFQTKEKGDAVDGMIIKDEILGLWKSRALWDEKVALFNDFINKERNKHFAMSIEFLFDKEEILDKAEKEGKKYVILYWNWGDARYNIKLHRIMACKSFGKVKRADVGGHVESESNLAHDGLCWIGYNASVQNNAVVSENAQVDGRMSWRDELYYKQKPDEMPWYLYNITFLSVKDNAKIHGNAVVYGDGYIWGDSEIYENASVTGDNFMISHARIHGKARVVSSDIYGSIDIRDNAICIASSIRDNLSEIRDDWEVIDYSEYDKGQPIFYDLHLAHVVGKKEGGDFTYDDCKKLVSLKYRLINASKQGKKYILYQKEGDLWRIMACKDIWKEPCSGVNVRPVQMGDFGGLVESEKNLSHDGACWIYGDAKVYENAVVRHDAEIWNDPCFRGKPAEVYGNAIVGFNARVEGSSRIYGDAFVEGDIGIVNSVIHMHSSIKNHDSSDRLVVYDTAMSDYAQVEGHWSLFNCDVHGLACLEECGTPLIKSGSIGNASIFGHVFSTEDFEKICLHTCYVAGLPLDGKKLWLCNAFH